MENKLPPAVPLAVARPLFSCLSLNQSDRLRLIEFPPEAVSWIHEAIAESLWPGGVQSTKEYGGSFEFKLKGYPWLGQGTDDAVACRRLMLSILRKLHSHGFLLVTSTDISTSECDKDTLVFRRVTVDPRPPPAMFSISFNMGDLLRVIDAPPELIPVVSMCITSRWPRGIQRTQVVTTGCTEFKFHGYPWTSNGTDAVSAREFVMTLLSMLEGHGWRLYASIDMSGNEYDKDSWFFEAIA